MVATINAPSSNARTVSPFAGRHIRGYRRPLDSWFYHPALREGQFRLYDVPAMLKDTAVNIGLLAIYGAIRRAGFEVRTNDGSKDLNRFIENTIYRFWHHDLGKVLPMYVPYGTSPCEVLYEKEDNQWKYAGMDDFHMLDVQAVLVGRHIKEVRVSNGGGSMLGGQVAPPPSSDSDEHEWNVLEHPKIFWAAHQSICGQPFGKSSLDASWGPWQEKSASHGAVSNRRLWAFSNSFRGCLVKYPEGFTQREDGTTVSNQDIAREMAEAYSTGAALTCPSGTYEDGSPMWEIIDPKLNGEISGLIEYPHQLDRDIWMGMGVPDEVLHAPDVGGSWSGRSGPLKIFYDIEDIRVLELITAFDVGPSGYTTRNDQAGGVLRPLVMENFGRRATYEVRPISLVPKPAEPGAGGSQQSAPGAATAPPTPTPGPMGAPPASLRLSGAELARAVRRLAS